MITYGGERVTLNTGVPGLNTIGVSLGRIARFCGHTQEHYTVLAHSFVVAGILPPEFGIYGLMHDTQEVLFSDVPTPMKSQVARNREHVAQRRIYIAYGLEWPLTEEVVELVEWADHEALIAEAHILQHPGAAAQWGSEYHAEAGKLTRKYLKKVPLWFDPAVSGPAFTKAYKKYMALAGLDQPDEWA